MDPVKNILESEEWTLVATYKPDEKRKIYRLEKEWEFELLEILKTHNYEYRQDLKNENDLIYNLRSQLGKLNEIKFSDNEWDKILYEITKKVNSVSDKNKFFQVDEIINLELDKPNNNGQKFVNIKLIDKKEWTKNSFQVVNQFSNENDETGRKSRYDVVILVNGLPLVLIELKKPDISIRKAFSQNLYYKKTSFNTEHKLFEYVQIFVISNGNETKYYSNTALDAIKNRNKKLLDSKLRIPDGFGFTSFLTDQKNNKIKNLLDFANHFFARKILWNILTKYCIIVKNDEKNNLIVMRPYQIVATEKIINRIKTKHNDPINSGGYIWHSTGSGKTLTSYKVAKLAADFDHIKKVIFVVDRKDLDNQTQDEYKKFETSNSVIQDSWGVKNTTDLSKILQKDNYNKKIIVTTIHKLSKVVEKYKNLPIYNEKVVFIFDECHRTQFGDMHQKVKKSFKKSFMFGFTGTPIFKESLTPRSGKDKEYNTKVYQFQTTEQLFGIELHRYSLINAIDDKTVLRFSYRNYTTMKKNENFDDRKVETIDEKEALYHPTRVKNNVKTIINYFNSDKQHRRFNSLFSVESIKLAQKYYEEFKKQLSENNPNKMKLAIIYSPDSKKDDYLSDFSENEEINFSSNEEFLKKAMDDFYQIISDTNNKNQESNYKNSKKGIGKFSEYQSNLAREIKKNKIDLTIVVNIFITGFDSPELQSLWLDRDLKEHTLIQAYSRTNRIYNDEKEAGIIHSFRNLEQNNKEALIIYAGDDSNKSTIFLPKYEEVYDLYKKIVQKLLNQFPPEKNMDSGSLEEKKQYIKIFNEFIRQHHLLNSFSQFSNKGQKLINENLFDKYKADYHIIKDQLHEEEKKEKTSILDGIEFETTLTSVSDYDLETIQSIINKHLHEDGRINYNIIEEIKGKIKSSEQLRFKSDLIIKFIEKINGNFNQKDIKNFDVQIEFRDFATEEFYTDIANFTEQNNLKYEETIELIKDLLENEKFEKPSYKQIRKISNESLGLRRADGASEIIEQHIENLRKNFYNKYEGISLNFTD
ncbi:Type I restriction enzyme EcoR124II R protein [Mesomycoplasma dispar]|uniref:Type I restriction enzyme endonuclease subunit n=1 Tax=Mesomycoplasma dispar TaxID=86660 RepID=A0AAJ5TCQ6_9BACT|nr:type I restriction endonuclease subunit R [Mesomycoplasma dispar]AJR12328.1 DEAD/DEAH box helicase [Mesomycoplasma dispar]VEU62147.1 Type I restriction enzyme EcoR124II R protein [Mesomycoplasma dispar]